VRADSCMILKKMRTLIDDCRDDYNWMDDDTKDYSPVWQITQRLFHTEGSPKSSIFENSLA